MKFFSLFLVLFSLTLGGCMTVNSPAVNSVNLDNIDFSDIETMKKGKSCSYNVLFVPFGSDRLFDATKDARIKKVKYVEKSFSGFPVVFFPLFSKSCIVAYGE